jgi:hypothetical protein
MPDSSRTFSAHVRSASAPVPVSVYFFLVLTTTSIYTHVDRLVLSVQKLTLYLSAYLSVYQHYSLILSESPLCFNMHFSLKYRVQEQEGAAHKLKPMLVCLCFLYLLYSLCSLCFAPLYFPDTYITDSYSDVEKQTLFKQGSGHIVMV